MSISNIFFDIDFISNSWLYFVTKNMKCLLTVIGLYVQIIRSFSQQCENKDLTIMAKTQTPSADFKPIFTTDHIKFGV